MNTTNSTIIIPLIGLLICLLYLNAPTKEHYGINPYQEETFGNIIKESTEGAIYPCQDMESELCFGLKIEVEISSKNETHRCQQFWNFNKNETNAQQVYARLGEGTIKKSYVKYHHEDDKVFCDKKISLLVSN